MMTLTLNYFVPAVSRLLNESCWCPFELSSHNFAELGSHNFAELSSHSFDKKRIGRDDKESFLKTQVTHVCIISLFFFGACC